MLRAIAARFFGIDLEQLAKDAAARIRAELKAKAKAKAEKAKPVAKKTAKASPAPKKRSLAQGPSREDLEEPEPDAKACPLTWEAVVELAARLKIKPHAGANSAANVWSCITKIHDVMAEEGSQRRWALRELCESSGTDSVDLAILYLADSGYLASDSGKAGHEDEYFTVCSKKPPPIKHGVPASKVRTCRVCGCTDTAACVDGIGECSWTEVELCSVCARVESEIVKLCAQARTEGVLVKALKAYEPKRVKAAIAGLVEKKRLKFMPGGKLVAGGAS